MAPFPFGGVASTEGSARNGTVDHQGKVKSNVLPAMKPRVGGRGCPSRCRAGDLRGFGAGGGVRIFVAVRWAVSGLGNGLAECFRKYWGGCFEGALAIQDKTAQAFVWKICHMSILWLRGGRSSRASAMR